MRKPSDIPPERHHVSTVIDMRSGFEFHVCDACKFKKSDYGMPPIRTEAEAERDHRRSLAGGRTRRGIRRG